MNNLEFDFESNPLKDSTICGIYVDSDSLVHITTLGENGERLSQSLKYNPFMWAVKAQNEDVENCEFKDLDGNADFALDSIIKFNDVKTYNEYLKGNKRNIFRMRHLESQALLANSARLFKDMKFSELRRVQVDIETHSTEGFPNPKNKADRIIAIGISGCGETRLIELEDFTDEAEKKLLEEFNTEIQLRDPDTIEGHNIFNFDLDYLYRRSKLLKIPVKWGRFDGSVSMRKTRVAIAERTVDLVRFDIAGRSVVDTYLLLQLFDISSRALSSYTLKNAAIHFGISKEEERTYIDGAKIKDMFVEDRATFRKYLIDDLRETKELADKLLPTYFAQLANFPLTFQECMLRGSSLKVESLLLEKYYEQKARIPDEMPASIYISGAMSEVMEIGVFDNILHYDVASLYPSLLLYINESPKNDYLNVFLQSLKELRAYRLKYKELAQSTQDAHLKMEYNARQQSFKILINSFYGYLGLNSAKFGDSLLADKVTTLGRKILQDLIEAFKANGAKIIEVDTDGIYLKSEDFYENPLELLSKVTHVLPKGIELDFDGKYEAMFCYKAKNYALREGDKAIIKGSAFRNRAMEAYLRNLTKSFIEAKLGLIKINISDLIKEVKKEIEDGSFDVELLAKSEYLSMSSDAYAKAVEVQKKPRRASQQAALLLDKKLSAGEKLSYYITQSDKKREADWKLARPVELFDKDKYPYSKEYYFKKLKDWIDRYKDFLDDTNIEDAPIQGELF
ncbi:MAG: DNA polymerase domain-containing protein [Opitutales bacterium]